MNFLTDFADQAVVLPLVGMVGLILGVQGWRAGALAWFAAVVATFGTMLVLKLVLFACGSAVGDLVLRSPSGHTAAAALVAGGLGWLLIRRATATFIVAMVAAAMIGASRILLGAHSLPEVLAGAAIGLGGVALLIRLAGVPPVLRLIPLAIAGLVVVVLFHGVRLPAEAAIQDSALRIGLLLPFCQPGQILPGQILPFRRGRRCPPAARYRPPPDRRRTAPRSTSAEYGRDSPAGGRSPAADRHSRSPARSGFHDRG